MSSLGEENNVQYQFQRIENRNLGVCRPLQYFNCNKTLKNEHFSINEQGIVSNYVKEDISPVALYFQSFHPQWPTTITPECTPFEPVPGNNFVASIHERPETSEASASSLRCNSYVPLPQLSDETLNAHLWSTDSEAASSGTENDDVAVTKRKFTGGPAGQHVYQQPSSNLHTPQYATFHYNSESLPQLSDETFYAHLWSTDSEAGSSGTENDDVAVTKRKFTGGPAGQHVYEQPSSNLHSPQYATFHYNSESLPQLSDETLNAHLWSTDSEAGSSGTENDDVAVTKRKFTGGPAGQHVYEQPSSDLHTPQYISIKFHYNSESRTMSSVSPNRDGSTLYMTFENRDSEASSSGAENGEVANTAVDNTLTEKNLTGGPGQQGNAKLKNKKRHTYVGLQMAYLENTFRENKYPDRLRRINIAHKLKLSEKQVMIWFQNRRSKDKRKKLKTRNISSMNTVASFNFSAPIENHNMPIFQASYQFQYMPQPLGPNVYEFH